jgi:hypothetical protein
VQLPLVHVTLQAVWSTIVVLVRAIWFVFSVANQFRVGAHWSWRRWDRLQLVPSWTFFAPNPGRSDLELYYRDVFEGERIGDWIKVPLAEPLAWISGIWYPKKRSKKILLDAVQSLLTLADKLEEDPNLIKITLPYLLLLHIVNEIPKPPGVLLRQFQVRESYGWFTEREPRILLQSEAHAV